MPPLQMCMTSMLQMEQAYKQSRSQNLDLLAWSYRWMVLGVFPAENLSKALLSTWWLRQHQGNKVAVK
jgi:hypothetical protein